MPAVDTMSRGLFGTPSQVDTSGLLIETMQVEEPRKSQHVPNHLLETSINLFDVLLMVVDLTYRYIIVVHVSFTFD